MISATLNEYDMVIPISATDIEIIRSIQGRERAKKMAACSRSKPIYQGLLIKHLFLLTMDTLILLYYFANKLGQMIITRTLR